MFRAFCFASALTRWFLISLAAAQTQTQSITFPQPAPGYGGVSAQLSATSSSGLPVTYSVVSGSATLNGSIVTYTGVGPGPMTVTLEADQPGNGMVAAAQPVQRTVPVTLLTTPVGSASDTISTVVSFAAAGTLGSIQVLTQGLPQLDFSPASGGTCTVGNTYSVGDSCIVEFIFRPGSPGMRYGGITLATSAGTPLGFSYLYATGTGPQVVWTVGTQTSLSNADDSVAPYFVIADPAGNVFMPNSTRTAITETLAAGGYTTTRILGSGFINPVSAALDGNGNIFVGDNGETPNGTTYPSTLREIVAAGGYTTVRTLVAGDINVNAFSSVVVDANGNILFVQDDAIKELTAASGYTTTKTVLPDLTGIYGLALDGGGNIYISIGYSVKEFTAASGYTLSVTLGGGYTLPLNLAVDAAGDVFVADEFARVIKEIPPGCGDAGCLITLDIPGLTTGNAFGVALDGTGSVYASGTTGNGAWKEVYSAPPSLTFASTPVGTPGTDSPQKVSLQNDGNLPLVNLPVAAGTQDPSISAGFEFTDTCPIAGGGAAQLSVLPGVVCTYAVSFLPTVVGTQQPSPGTLITVDNNLNAASTAVPYALQTVLLNAGVGTPVHFVVNAPPTVQAGVPFTFLVTAEDNNGNVVNLYAGTPRFTSTDPGAILPAGTVLNSGTATFTATLYTAPTQTISATDPVYPVAGISLPIQVLGGRLTPPPTLLEPVGTTSSMQSANVQFAMAGTLGSIAVLTDGLPGLDFALVSGGSCKVYVSYVAGATCTVSYTFTPRHPGARNGGVTLTSTGGSLLGSSLMGGIGTGPQVVWSKGSATKVGSGFAFPPCMSVDVAGNVFIADTTSNVVRELLASGNYATSRALGSGLTKPLGVALDGNGNIFLSDSTSDTVKEIVASGGYATVNSLPATPTPGCMTLDGNGNVFFVDTGLPAVEELTAISGHTASLTLGGSQANFEQPAAIAVDASGNLYVTDVISNSVTEILATGGYTTLQTIGGGFNFPLGIAVDASGTVFVSDIGSNTVKAVPPGCIVASCVTTLATSGVQHPYGLAVDGSGDLYVSDPSASEVLKLDFIDPPSITFAASPVGSVSSDSPQAATLINDGNAALQFLPGMSGAAPVIANGFLLDSTSTCPQLPSINNVVPTLGLGQSCAYAVDFKPVAAGPDSGTLQITDNDLNATGAQQSVPLNGSGLALVTAGLSVSPNPAYAGQVVTIVATVGSAGSAVPSGTVTILDGSSPLGTPSLNAAGQATLTTNTLSVGTHALTAVYTANASFGGATSPVVQEVILAGSFTISLSPASLTVDRGLAGSTTIQLTSIGNFAGPLTLSYGQLPTFASAALNTSSVDLNAGGNASATLAFNTLQQTAVAILPQPSGRPWPGIFLACALLLPSVSLRRKRLTNLIAFLGLVVAFQFLAGCNSLRLPLNEVAPGSYEVPITATDAEGNGKSATLTVNVVAP